MSTPSKTISRIVTVSAFDKDVKRLKRKRYRMELMLQAVAAIVEGNRQVLSTQHRDHALTGDWKGYRELHISADWLLIYCIEGKGLVLVLTRTASHDDLYSQRTPGKTIKSYARAVQQGAVQQGFTGS